MPYKLSTHPNHTVEVVAHAEADVVARERQSIVHSLRGRLQVPGFRRGKAPLPVVEARFGDEIRDELRDRLAGVLWREVLEAESELRPLTEPALQDQGFSEDGVYRFTASFEVRPHLDIAPLDDVALPPFSLEVTEADIDAEIEKLQEEQASWEPADDVQAEDAMLVEADLHGEMEGGAQEPYSEENARFVIGGDGVPPEISEALQGARVGDKPVAEKRFPDDDSNTERAGKKVTYTIAVKALKRKVLPEIDDDLATAVGVDSLTALRERIVQALTRQKTAQRRDSWRRFLLDHFQKDMDANDLPSSLVTSAVNEDLTRFAYTMAMQGISPESDDVNWQEIATRVEPQARRKVLDNLVLEQLAETWAIDVPEGDVDTYIRAEAERQGLPPAEHKANLAKENKLEQIRHAARLSATVDELIRRAGGEVE